MRVRFNVPDNVVSCVAMKGEILTQCSHGGKFDIRHALTEHINKASRRYCGIAAFRLHQENPAIKSQCRLER